MLQKTFVSFIALIFSLSLSSQDCENYFLYQQHDSVTFTFQGFMVVPSQAMFTWDLGDGATANGKVVTHTYTSPGVNTFEVCLYTETYDSLGNPCNDTSCQNIQVGVPPECAAYFFANPSPGSPDTWYFTDFSSGSPSLWSWDFGDGSTSNLQSPMHVYALGGSYNVCLTISDTTGNCDDTYCLEILVDIPGGDICESDFTYTTNDLLTFDFEGFMLDTTQQAIEYSWDFGDGSTGTGQTITHTFEPAGTTIPVCLTTTYVFLGGDTCIFESCRDVYVGNAPTCQALYTWEFGSQPYSVNFTDLSTGDPTLWDWDFGDSTYSTEQHPTHIFPKDGIFSVCLTITNENNGCTSTICTDVNVTNVPPPVDCYNVITHTPGADIFTFNFHGEAFSDELNVSANSTFTWNLGDGNTANGQDITHTYGSTGTFAVTLATVSIINAADTCVAYSYDSIFISDISYCIGGNVFIDTATHADAGQVYLTAFDAINSNIVSVATVSFDNNGNYLFENVNHGNGLSFYVQADLSQQSSYFGQYVPTYHYDAIYWEGAQTATEEECPGTIVHDIIMQESTAAATGNGSISGVVYNNDTKVVMQGVEILLLSESMEPLMYVHTDENGLFGFNSLAYGSYYVYPEMVGIETTGFLVTLSEDDASIEISILIDNGIASLSVEEYSEVSLLGAMYPNPANSQIRLNVSAEKALNVGISVYNQLGQQMIIQQETLIKGLNTVELNISNLPESVYYVRIQAEGSKPLMRTFIKVNP
ncbi:MAG: PKD domain-containing protein [Bacteroidota bacterium]